MSELPTHNPVDNNHGERIRGLEEGQTATKQALTAIQGVQRDQWSAINTLTSSVEHVSAGMDKLIAVGVAKSGTFSTQTLYTIAGLFISFLVAFGGFAAWVFFVQLSPMQTQISQQRSDFQTFAHEGSPALQKEILVIKTEANALRNEFNSVQQAGSPVTRERLARLEQSQEWQQKMLDGLHNANLTRTNEEAAAYRALLRDKIK